MQRFMDRLSLRHPGLRRRHPQGDDRALVPHALDDVRRGRAAGGGAGFGRGRGGQLRLFDATKRSRTRFDGHRLTAAMTNSNVFPNMVLQMCAIGEESGALDAHALQGRGLLRAEVDEAVDSPRPLMEPMIMVILGGLIGGIVVAMYLPIFKMGQAI